MPYSNSVLQNLVEVRGVNCNKQGQSPRSRHEVARGGTGRGGGGCPPSPDGKKMEIRKCLDDQSHAKQRKQVEDI